MQSYTDDSLTYLNAQPVRFAEDVEKCLERGFPDGLNSDRSFRHIALDTQIINEKVLARMRELQPNAKVRSHFCCGSTD